MMSKRTLSGRLALAAVTCVALVVTISASTATLTAFRARLGQPVEASPRMGPGGEADEIALHGDWVIEVHEADGQPVSRTEFSNDLTPEGRTALLELLLGRASTDHWRVVMNGTARCGMSAPCVAQQGRFELPSPEPGSLGVAPDRAGSGLGLRGYVGVSADGQLTNVASWLDTCTFRELRSEGRGRGMPSEGRSPGGFPPNRNRLCAVDEDWLSATRVARPFTQTSIPRPVTVTAGQLVYVEVHFTFSGTTRREPSPAAAAAGVGAGAPGTTPPAAPPVPRLLP